MQIRLDRRRLHAQERPGAEMETEMGGQEGLGLAELLRLLGQPWSRHRQGEPGVCVWGGGGLGQKSGAGPGRPWRQSSLTPTAARLSFLQALYGLLKDHQAALANSI